MPSSQMTTFSVNERRARVTWNVLRCWTYYRGKDGNGNEMETLQAQHAAARTLCAARSAHVVEISLGHANGQ